MIRCKSSAVRLNLASPAIVHLLLVLGRLDAAHETRLSRGSPSDYDGDLVVTSGNDSSHSPTSRHYRDEAIDIRTHNFRSRDAKRLFRLEYEQQLGPQFRVILEGEGSPNEHFHAQVGKGTELNATLLPNPYPAERRA